MASLVFTLVLCLLSASSATLQVKPVAAASKQPVDDALDIATKMLDKLWKEAPKEREILKEAPQKVKNQTAEEPEEASAKLPLNKTKPSSLALPKSPYKWSTDYNSSSMEKASKTLTDISGRNEKQSLERVHRTSDVMEKMEDLLAKSRRDLMQAQSEKVTAIRQVAQEQNKDRAVKQKLHAQVEAIQKRIKASSDSIAHIKKENATNFENPPAELEPTDWKGKVKQWWSKTQKNMTTRHQKSKLWKSGIGSPSTAHLVQNQMVETFRNEMADAWAQALAEQSNRIMQQAQTFVQERDAKVDALRKKGKALQAWKAQHAEVPENIKHQVDLLDGKAKEEKHPQRTERMQRRAKTLRERRMAAREKIQRWAQAHRKGT